MPPPFLDHHPLPQRGPDADDDEQREREQADGHQCVEQTCERGTWRRDVGHHE